MLIKSYVYKITCIKTGEYFIGSRGTNINDGVKPENDLWVRYFSSSRAFKRMISEYGKDGFTTEVLSKHKDETLAHASAEKVIRAHIDNKRCLNRKFQREDGLTYEEQQEQKLVAANLEPLRDSDEVKKAEAQKKAWEKRRKKKEKDEDKG
jgi:hypothetical protein